MDFVSNLYPVGTTWYLLAWDIQTNDLVKVLSSLLHQNGLVGLEFFKIKSNYDNEWMNMSMSIKKKSHQWNINESIRMES